MKTSVVLSLLALAHQTYATSHAAPLEKRTLDHRGLISNVQVAAAQAIIKLDPSLISFCNSYLTVPTSTITSTTSTVLTTVSTATAYTTPSTTAYYTTSTDTSVSYTPATANATETDTPTTTIETFAATTTVASFTPLTTTTTTATIESTEIDYTDGGTSTTYDATVTITDLFTARMAKFRRAPTPVAIPAIPVNLLSFASPVISAACAGVTLTPTATAHATKTSTVFSATSTLTITAPTATQSVGVIAATTVYEPTTVATITETTSLPPIIETDYTSTSTETDTFTAPTVTVTITSEVAATTTLATTYDTIVHVPHATSCVSSGNTSKKVYLTVVGGDCNGFLGNFNFVSESAGANLQTFQDPGKVIIDYVPGTSTGRIVLADISCHCWTVGRGYAGRGDASPISRQPCDPDNPPEQIFNFATDGGNLLITSAVATGPYASYTNTDPTAVFVPRGYTNCRFELAPM